MALTMPEIGISTDVDEKNKWRMYDLNGDGVLSDVEKMMMKYDTDGNGTFSLAEVKAVIADLHQTEKEKHQYKRLSLGMFLLCFAALAAMLGTSVWGAQLTKESHVQDDIMTSLDGHIVKTTAAKQSLPLLVAPVLPDDLELDTINIKYSSPALYMRDATGARAKVHEKFKVETTVRANDTFITFYSAFAFFSNVVNASEHGAAIMAKEVRVWNGKSTALLTDGSVVELCGGETTCSALKANSAEEKATLINKAKSALALHSGEPQGEGKRRLWSTLADLNKAKGALALRSSEPQDEGERRLWSTCLD